MQLTGAQILMEGLKRENVEILFGYPGGALYEIYDELSRTDIRHVLVRHEQGAVHAADGYARSSGAVGVCLVTSGPGATNTVTGIATAYMDSIPMVVLTGQVPTALIGNDAFQEVDIVGITRPCTKHNFLVKDVADLALTLRKAFHIARSGRPGPVLVDLPRDVMRKAAEFAWPESIELNSYKPNYKPNKLQLQRTADHLIKAKKPLLIIGGGLVFGGGGEELTALARECAIPVASTFMGLSGFPGNDPLWLGTIGMHGGVIANLAASEADCLIAVGTRFSDRSTSEISKFAANATIIQIDIDPTSIHKNVPVQIPLVADCVQAIIELRKVLAHKGADKNWQADHAEWLADLAKTKRENPLTYGNGNSPAIRPQRVVEALCELTEELTGGDVIVATDVGQHQMWASQFFTYTKPRSFLSSGGLGTMGFGLPAAVGAQLANPGKAVVVITGDGSFQMNMQELATVMENKLPIKIVLLNNHALGMVRQWQELFFEKNYVSTVNTLQPDFMQLAKTYGMAGFRITDNATLKQELKAALEAPGAAIIEVEVNPGENVSPLVPPGAALDEMIII
ncbi:biosynthetic-type acetolactate synthase large subunit [Desulfovibrio sp. OttesenSCG-928-O18]|nr:biosynthetic-type acetolactate synthase large subunit [Desulfovibrio sp. OttesenSCG-928-O18]